MSEMYGNTNNWNCSGSIASVMKFYFDSNLISSSFQRFIGWGDFDGDGTLDPQDNTSYGNGGSKVGVFQNGVWYLDYNGNGVKDVVDKAFTIGQVGDIPVVGDWNNSGSDKVGIFRNGLWGLDYNGNFGWDGADKAFTIGQAGDVPVVGDWNNGGSDKVGIFRNGLWGLDYNGNFGWDGSDKAFTIGQAGDVPVVGNWL